MTDQIQRKRQGILKIYETAAFEDEEEEAEDNKNKIKNYIHTLE